MSNYTPISNFTAKDALTTGDSNKRILGATIDAETSAIATAITSKLNTSDLTGNYTITGNITFTGTNVIPAAGLTGTVIDARLSANVALLNADNVFSKAGGSTQTITSTSANRAAVQFQTSSVTRGLFGADGAAGDIIVGSALGDISLRAVSGIFNVSLDNGGTIHHKLSSAAATTTLNGITLTDFARVSQSNTFTNTNLFSINGGTVFRSTIATAAINNYLSFQDSALAERGYVGFGIGASSIFSVRNATAGAELRLSTNSGSITLDGVAATDFARLSQNNTFLGSALTLSNVGNPSVFVTSTTGPITGFMQADSGTSAVDIGSVTAHKLDFYTSGSVKASISSAGNFDFKAGTVTTNNASASEVGYKGLPQNAQVVDYTLVLADANKYLQMNANSKTFTIPANASVAFPIGTTLTFEMNGTAIAGNIAITSDTLYLAGTGYATTGNRTLANGGIATAVKRSATSWIISGTGLS